MDWLTFWDDPAFWPSFWAEFIVGVFIVAFVGWLVSRVRAPKPKARIMVAIADLPDGWRRYSFFVQNTGDFALRSEEVRWELFIPHDEGRNYNFGVGGAHLYPQRGEVTLSNGTEYISFHEVLREPLFQGTSVKLFEWVIPPRDPALEGVLHYVLSTPYGQIPKKVKRTDNGRVVVSTAARVEPYRNVGTLNVTDNEDRLEARAEVRDPEPGL